MAATKYYIKKEIVQKLFSDVSFRMRLAVHIELGERAVFNFTKLYLENPIPDHHLTRKNALDFFKAEGYDEADVITTEIPA